ncbi:thioredoxin domain-containing protein [Microbacterium sp. NPDC077644]|uniref:Thioredoxin domain-containing protein n=1 Tax=Microbacterium tenebrionis TaxID=2830665 RepID=A0A9X1S1G1_9MICO|nr:thioredoxin domain-containing protein [Microbacterium tenebrionis]MCC2030165.1 thioredoxin domain-containing protein [Microbacterium tenebrionis]
MKPGVKAGIVTAAVVVVLMLIVFVVVIVNQNGKEPPTSDGSAPSAPVQRENSHVLDDGGEGAITVVEFLDFECEACGAFYPIVEDLRAKYDGKITYVVRYFPLPGHLNSRNAALAAEAAAQQGRLDDMYRELFETQAEWGEAQESRADVFRGFAEQLGLDMPAYDKAVADPATTARIDVDFNDGQALGVDSTPTFYVDGEKLQLQQFDDLENAIKAALETQ